MFPKVFQGCVGLARPTVGTRREAVENEIADEFEENIVASRLPEQGWLMRDRPVKPVQARIATGVVKQAPQPVLVVGRAERRTTSWPEGGTPCTRR